MAQDPGPLLVTTPYGSALFHLGDDRTFFSPPFYRFSPFSFGIDTKRRVLRVIRQGEDTWTVTETERGWQTSVRRPWAPIPLLAVTLNAAVLKPSGDVNAIFHGKVAISQPSGPPPPEPPAGDGTPPEPSDAQITGSPYDPNLPSVSRGGSSTMPFHVSFEYEMQMDRTAGWSVNYWNNLATLDQVETAAKALAQESRYLLGSQSVLRFIRISNAPPPGVQTPVLRKVRLIEYQTGTNAGVQATEHSDYPTSALAILLGDGQDIKVRIWLKGVRDEFIAKGGKVDRDSAGLVAAFLAYRKELITPAKGWVTRVLQPPNGPKDVVEIDAAGLVTTQEAHQFGDGNPIRIKNCQVNKYPNRIWRITVGANTKQFTLRRWNPPLPFVPPEGQKITATLQFYGYVPITDVKLERATKKNVGKPKRLLGGKRKTKR